MVDGASITKAALSQYVRHCWHKEAVSTEKASRDCSKRSSSHSNAKELFSSKILGPAGLKKVV